MVSSHCLGNDFLHTSVNRVGDVSNLIVATMRGSPHKYRRVRVQSVKVAPHARVVGILEIAHSYLNATASMNAMCQPT